MDEALQVIIPALLALLEALPGDSPFQPLDPPPRRQRTLDALKRVLVRESQVQPLLPVCEDLHWIDAETQALLDTLVESLPTAQIPLLVNYPSRMFASWGCGLLALRQGNLPRALPRLEHAVGICQDADFPSCFPRMGAAYTLAERGAEAVPLLTQATEQTTATERLAYQAPVVSP